jgi:uncharacterized protein (DUF2235 family)
MADVSARNIVLCADGTWASEATSNVPTNIRILAKSFAHGLEKSGSLPRPGNTDAGSAQDRCNSLPTLRDTYPYNERTKTWVCYFEGVGANADISTTEHLVDAALAVSIKEKCIEAYRFIADVFTGSENIYMFGFSRGAYTVRCVAGMINNCGIVDFHKLQASGEELQKTKEYLCEEVYYMYRSRDPKYAPTMPWPDYFRKSKSHVTSRPPITFMGLFDTVSYFL